MTSRSHRLGVEAIGSKGEGHARVHEGVEIIDGPSSAPTKAGGDLRLRDAEKMRDIRLSLRGRGHEAPNLATDDRLCCSHTPQSIA